MVDSTESVVRAPESASTRVWRYALQRYAGRVLRATRLHLAESRQWADLARLTDRVTYCARYPGYQSDGVSILGRDTESGVNARYHGLARCANPWVCPLCAESIARRRRVEVEQIVAGGFQAGLHCYFATWTVRHGPVDPLACLIPKMADALRRWRQRQAVRRAYYRAGFLGVVRVLEVRHGRDAGWHPHYHALIFTARPLDTSGLASAWVDALSSVGLSATQAHGFDVRKVSGAQCEGVAEYVAKIGTPSALSWEVADNQRTKTGSSRTPIQLLADAMGGETFARKKWLEYVSAMRGRAQVYVSPALRANIRLLSDEEAAEPEPDELDRVLFDLTDADWLAITCHRDLRAAVLEVAEYDPGHLRQFVDNALAENADWLRDYLWRAGYTRCGI